MKTIDELQTDFIAELFETDDSRRVAGLMWRVYVGDGTRPSAMYCKPDAVRENFLEVACGLAPGELAEIESMLLEQLDDHTDLKRTLQCEDACEKIYNAHGWETFGPYECFFRKDEMP